MENLSDQLYAIQVSLGFVIPEVILTFGLITILIIGLISKKSFVLPKFLSAATYLICLVVILSSWPADPINLFGDMMRLDDFSSGFKILFLSGGLITILITEQKQNSTEYFLLIMAAVLGACLLAMSMNFIMLLLSLELISLSSYVLAGVDQQKQSSEASMKYFLFGAVSTAVMVYGFSILYGEAGTLNFASEDFVSNLVNNTTPLLLIGGLLVLAGLLYKISAAPFHFWTPDVYQASPTAIVAFFSVVPKLAGFSILIKISLALHLFGQSGFDWMQILSIIAIITVLAGNLSALLQTNIKRMMGYSSIAQSGFLLMGVVTMSKEGVHFVIFYSLVFLLANFLVFISIQQFEKNDFITFESLRGKGKNFWMTGILVLVGLISLTGLPPTAGFTGKLFLFSALWETFQQTEKSIVAVLLMTGLINTVISLFFYLKIPYYLYLKTSETAGASEKFSIRMGLSALLAAMLVYLFVQPEVVMNWISSISFML